LGSFNKQAKIFGSTFIP